MKPSCQHHAKPLWCALFLTLEKWTRTRNAIVLALRFHFHFYNPKNKEKAKTKKLLECFSTQPFIQHEEEEEETQTKRASEFHALTSRLLGDLVLDNIDFINSPGFREHGGQLLLRKLPRQLTYKQLNGI